MPSRAEILAYLEHCAEKYGLLPHCHFSDGVKHARWDESTARWSLETESGRVVEAEFVVSGVGMFNELSYPDIEGLDSFAGTSFHSAAWNWDHDLTGEDVGVIGSAASAVQFGPPADHWLAHCVGPHIERADRKLTTEVARSANAEPQWCAIR